MLRLESAAPLSRQGVRPSRDQDRLRQNDPQVPASEPRANPLMLT